MTSDANDFDRFLEQRHAAAAAYVGGDPAPLGRLVARELPATFFAPRGDATAGTREVWERYERDDAAFAAGGTNEMETLATAAGDQIAYWVGFQRSQARLVGQDEPVPFELRVTEIYRREQGEWKLVHRHADPFRAGEPASP